MTAPVEFHGLTTDLENLIRAIKRWARKLADHHPELTLASCVSVAYSSHNNGFKTGGYSPVNWAFGTDNQEHGFTTTMPSEIETFRISAMNRYLHEQARDAISRAQHTTRRENFYLATGTWVINFRRGKVTRGVIGAPSKSGLWLEPAPVIMTEAVQQWSGSVHSTTRLIGVDGVSHGNKLIRCHPAPLRRCSEREVSIASPKSLVQISMPTSVTELTNALSPGQNEDLSASLPTGDDLHVVRWILENLLLVRKPWNLPLYLCFTLWHRGRSVAKHSHSFVIPDPVSESAGRESDVQVDESSVAPGSMQTSPRDLTRNQGELVRSSLENADPATVRRRIVGKRTIIPPVPSASSANVDSVRVPDSLPEAGMPEAWSPLQVTRRNVEWNLLTNRWTGSREKGHP